jgi:DNA-directed RNA polymerase subunit RPC12/RpoP
MRRRLHTTRNVCATMVSIDQPGTPIMCPTCGSRVI